MPGQSKEEFRANVRILRGHFEQFNRDVAGVCQWLMGIRPGGKRGFGDEVKPFWDFFLQPEEALKDRPEDELDHIRLKVFSVAAGWGMPDSLKEYDLPEELLKAIQVISLNPLQPTNTRGQELFGRLKSLDDTHSRIILKAAGDWVYGKYQRLFENWEENRPIWEEEKKEWENQYQELMKVEDRFSKIFTELDIKEKSPRICLANEVLDPDFGCKFNGPKIPVGEPDKPTKEPKFVAHTQICHRYWNFCRKMSTEKNKFNKGRFVKNANRYLEISARSQSKKLTGDERMRVLFTELSNDPKFKERFENWEFPRLWNAYCKEMNLNVKKMRDAGGIENLHCTGFAGKCRFITHTERCFRFKEKVKDLPKEMVALDKDYRDWRRKCMVGPRRPVFTYPSPTSPAPKIFGEHYFLIDWDRSIVGIRLDNMPEGEFVEFRFKEWPSSYDIRNARDRVSSVHLNFVGTRAKLAFRFEVSHLTSRFGITQEEIEQLRSGEHRPREDEREFPATVRQALLKSFKGDPEKELRILAVDTGTTAGAAVGLFVGKSFKLSEPIKLVKSKTLHLSTKEIETEREFKLPDGSKEKRYYVPGLSREHHALHLEKYGSLASKLTDSKKRPTSKRTGAVGISRNDLRHLGLHAGWMIRDWARLNAAQIMEAAVRHKVDLILFESQRGFLAPGYDKISEAVKKHRMAFWPYGLVRRKLTEKAVERGMRVVLVPYKGSSKTCPNCGAKQNKSHFSECKQCNYKPENRDESAVRVLGQVFWGMPLPEAKVA